MFVIMGATGKVGRATIAALRRRGAPVRAVLREASKAAEFAALGCETAIADLRDAEALRAAIAGAGAVQVICPMSMAAADAPADMRGMIETMAGALDAVRPAKVLAISDYGAERAAGTGVTLTFHALEARLRALPTGLTLLRSAEHMQNWSRLAKAAAASGILPSLHHPLTKLFPTVSASDVGLVAADLLAAGDAAASPRIVHVEGPRRYTPVDVAEALASVAGRPIVARELPRPDWIAALTLGGLGMSYARLVTELYDAHNAGAIDVEPGAGDVRYGATELRDVLAAIMRN
ncbi:MAG: NAD(P)H-binding protein [Rhizobiales bacterium]|nr:NAD(P)H-binding protein [Hyphomicrobiales bacterium]